MVFLCLNCLSLLVFDLTRPMRLIARAGPWQHMIPRINVQKRTTARPDSDDELIYPHFIIAKSTIQSSGTIQSTVNIQSSGIVHTDIPTVTSCELASLRADRRRTRGEAKSGRFNTSRRKSTYKRSTACRGHRYNTDPSPKTNDDNLSQRMD